MDISEQIIHIITRDKSIVYSQKKAEKELLSLLKKLNDSDKKSLKPIIIKLMRQYNKEMFNTNGSQEKYNLACMAGFIMLNYTEYKSHWGVNYDNFLNWYCPSWFSEYYNNDQWMNIGYERLLEYMKKGYLKPSGTKIAQELVNLENSYNDFKRITLTEHIWTLFLYESEVHLTHRYPKFGKLEWKRKLCELSDTKKIDRNKLLTECLLVSTRNFNKIVVGFFLDLFNELTPTNDELLNVQETLFTVLQTQHSKPINQTLKYIKQIHYDPSFNLQDFIEQIPLLLTWDVKAVINGTLSLVDVLARAYPKHKKELMLLAVQTLAQQDETLQTKTIKLISKHKLLADSEIVEEINIYKDGLFHSSKALLPHVAEEHSLAEEVTTITPPQHIREDNRIPSYETFDEMVFFFSQVFEGNNVYDFDLFLHLLPKLKECVNVDNIDRLVPALQRAFKYFQQTVTDEVGNSQILLYTAITFIRYLIPTYQIFSPLDNQAKIYSKKMSSVKVDYSGSYLDEFEKEELHSKSTEISRCLLRYILSGNSISLSTPTHKPCWISLDTLVNRLSSVSIEQIDTFDFEIALGRTIGDLNNLNLSMLDVELQDLINFIFGDLKFDIDKVKHPHIWFAGILRKNDTEVYHQFLGHVGITVADMYPFDITWKAYLRPWEYETWEKGIKVKKQTTSPKITMTRKHYIDALPFETIYKHTNASIVCDVLPKFDDKYYFCIAPLAMHPFAQSLLQALSKDYESAFGKRCATNALAVFNSVWQEQQTSNYLLLSYGMVYVDRTTRTIVSELWIKATNEGTMNHQLLGETLGKLEHNEYAPLKRFTDLIISNMLNISTLHNQGLHTLFSSMIVHMNDEPIKGTKKLLEIYLEILNLTKMEVPVETLDKLGIWGEVKSLKSIVKKLCL